MQERSLTYKVGCGLFIFGAIFFIGIGKIPLFDLDELYFAEITREMMVSGHYHKVTFYFQPLYEKPPLFFWIQAASMQLWGINEVGARFPNVVCGLLTLGTLFYIGKQQGGKTFGLLWMFLYATAFLPHFYFKSGIIDPFLNYFMLGSLYFSSHITQKDTVSTNAALSTGLCIGLALLLKGPIGALIPLATIALAQLYVSRTLLWKSLLIPTATASIILSIWLIPEIMYNGLTFIKEFWAYHSMLYHQPVATHNQPWYYHFLVLFWGCFPSSLFALATMKIRITHLFKAYPGAICRNYFAAYMKSLCIIVPCIFTLVGTKILHYSAMTYFPITFFATHFLHQRIPKNKISTPPWIIGGFILGGLTIGICMTLLPWIMQHQALWSPYIKNVYIRDALNLPLSWKKWDGIPGILYLLGTCIASYYLLKRRFIAFSNLYMTTNVLCLTLFLTNMAPKVAAYTQQAIVDFCKTYKNKEVYLTTLGFKAAAPLFYTHKSPAIAAKEQDTNWLLTGPIDKPCFFILYKSEAKWIEGYKDIFLIKEEGCYAFYKRMASSIA